MSTQDIHSDISLAALLAHPDFQQGLAIAHEQFHEAFESAPLTDAEIVEEICVELNEVELETSESPVLQRLGYVVGTIAEGLSYAPEVKA